MRKEYDFSSGKRGAVLAPSGKTRITIMLDADVLDHYRNQAEALGCGYQTLINAALKAEVRKAGSVDSEPLTLAALRKVLRQELRAA